MKQLPNYADQRFNGQCVYCGAYPDTKEHIPPKVFLDRPFPENLPVVEACTKCNNGFSLDEEYMACLIDCIISGSADPNNLQRNNIKRILESRPQIAKRLQNACRVDNGMTHFEVEVDRIKNVVTKIGLGHVLYELNLLLSESPQVEIAPFELLSDNEVRQFEGLSSQNIALWPEVGSRAMQRLIVEDKNYIDGWVVVQPARYRYAVMQSEVTEIRMVFSEYLFCTVCWGDE